MFYNILLTEKQWEEKSWTNIKSLNKTRNKQNKDDKNDEN